MRSQAASAGGRRSRSAWRRAEVRMLGAGGARSCRAPRCQFRFRFAPADAEGGDGGARKGLPAAARRRRPALPAGAEHVGRGSRGRRR